MACDRERQSLLRIVEPLPTHDRCKYRAKEASIDSCIGEMDPISVVAAHQVQSKGHYVLLGPPRLTFPSFDGHTPSAPCGAGMARLSGYFELSLNERQVIFCGLPAEHWQHLRTRTPIESMFAGVGVCVTDGPADPADADAGSDPSGGE